VVEPLAPDASETAGEKRTAPDKVKDAKARTIIMGYCIPEPLSRILHLKTAQEQWQALERLYLPTGRQ
jgi:hypothetical protein